MVFSSIYLRLLVATPILYKLRKQERVIMIRFNILIFVVMLLNSCSQPKTDMGDKTKVVEIYSIPFSYETYAATSMDNIEKTHIRYGTINTYNTDFKIFLENMLKMKPCKDFSNKRVRVKFIFYDKRVIYINKTGCVIDSNNNTHQLDSNNFKKIKKLIFNHSESIIETAKEDPIRSAL